MFYGFNFNPSKFMKFDKPFQNIYMEEQRWDGRMDKHSWEKKNQAGGRRTQLESKIKY